MQINNAATRLHRIQPVISTPLVMPLTTNEEIVKAWRNFQELKLKLLDDQDFVVIKNERYAKKSAFRKLALAFGISCEIVREERVALKDGFAYEITMRATSPAGRFMTAVAGCHSSERKFNKVSDVRAIAQTRATNRSIADLIGWSAPSAEEMITEEMSDEGRNEPTPDRQPPDNPQSANGDQAIYSIGKDSQAITDKQRALLVGLINQKIYDRQEREMRLADIDGLSKQDAHELISMMLSYRN